jgi:hypothetical protein
VDNARKNFFVNYLKTCAELFVFAALFSEIIGWSQRQIIGPLWPSPVVPNKSALAAWSRSSSAGTMVMTPFTSYADHPSKSTPETR